MNLTSVYNLSKQFEPQIRTNRILTSVYNLGKQFEPQNVGPDLDPNCLTLIVFVKEFFLKKLICNKTSKQQKHEKLPGNQDVFVKHNAPETDAT